MLLYVTKRNKNRFDFNCSPRRFLSLLDVGADRGCKAGRSYLSPVRRLGLSKRVISPTSGAGGPIMTLLLIIIIILLLAGGGYGYGRAGWTGPYYGGGIGLIVIILIVLILLGYR